MAKESVKFRLDEDELAEIDLEAEAEGLSRSAYIRRILKQRDGNGSDDLAELRERIGELEERIGSGDSTRPRAHETDAVRDAVESVDLPSTKDVDDCVDAVRAAVGFIKTNEKATMREIVQGVMPEHSLGYDVPELKKGERYRGAWWRRIVKPSLDQMGEVESPSVGGSAWTYVGE